MPAGGAVWDPVSAGALGTRPGTYINFESEAVAPPVVSAFGTSLLIGPADWGPVGEAVEIFTPADADSYLGSVASGIRTTVLEMLKQGVQKILFYRIASSPAAAALTLNDSVPNPAITVTAKYTGTFGNQISVEVVDNVDAVNKDLNVYVGGVLREKFTGNDNDGIVAAYTSQGSNYVVLAVAGTSNRVPANITATPLAGGASGSAVTATEYTNALTAAASLSFRTLSLYTSDTAIQVSTRTWTRDRRNLGKKIVYFAGAALDETFTNKATQAVALNYEGVVYVVSDYELEDGSELAAFQAAAVVAAMHAKHGVASLTSKPVVGAAGVNTTFTDAQYSEGLTKGMLILSEDDQEGVVVEQGLTTLQPASQVAPKSRDYRKLRYIAIIDTLADRIRKKLNQDYVGDVENDPSGRDEAVRMVQTVLNGAMDERLLLRGIDPETGEDVTATAFLDPRYVSNKDAVFIAASGQAIDAAEKFFLSVKI